MTPHKSPVGVLTTQYLGLFNLSSNGQPYNHLFAVEFDTIKNEEFQDINDNHVGVDINELTSEESKPAGYWVDKDFRDLDLNNGQNIQAWIDYDHLQRELNVTIVQAGSLRPRKPLIFLSAIVEEEMYVGFSAATGIYVEDHYILAWSFSTNGEASFLDTTHLPSFLPHQNLNIGLIVGVSAIGVSAILTFVIWVMFVGFLLWLKRRQRRNFVEEWEAGYWPHRYNYRDLYIATKGFRDDQILGSGGFGRVYKGVLPATGLQVAVKSICQEGVKEFVAEISSLGRLKHRNLVQIRGYCRREKQLFVVYDYMPTCPMEVWTN